MTVERAYGVLERIVHRCKSIEGELEDALTELRQVLGRAETLRASDLATEQDWDDLHGHGIDKTLYDVELAERAAEQASGYLRSAYWLVP
jgi:hypothetical protein